MRLFADSGGENEFRAAFALHGEGETVILSVLQRNEFIEQNLIPCGLLKRYLQMQGIVPEIVFPFC